MSETPPDVGVILEQLRAEVRARRLAEGGAEPGPIERDLRRSLDEIELHRVVSAHWPLKARSLPGRAVVLVNKVVRRLLRWYINPIVEQQNAYNDAVARALRLVAEAYAELAEDVRAVAQESAAPGAPPAGGAPAGAGRDELQRLVEERGLAEPPARFVELELDSQRRQVELRQRVSAHWPLPARTPAERAAAAAQMGARRYLRWLVNPIVEQQNNANAAFAAALRDVARLDSERRAQVAALRAARGRRRGG